MSKRRAVHGLRGADDSFDPERVREPPWLGIESRNGEVRRSVPGNQTFRRSERLRLRREFARVFAEKRSQADGALVIYVAPNNLEWSRLGIRVNKRIGNAVRRNYVKRRIREAFRTQKGELPRGLDIICVARSKAADPRHDLARSLRTLLSKAAYGMTPPGHRNNRGT